MYTSLSIYIYVYMYRFESIHSILHYIVYCYIIIRVDPLRPLKDMKGIPTSLPICTKDRI